MDFNLGDKLEAFKGIVDCIAVVGVCTWVYDDALGAIAVGFLKSVDNGSLVIGLVYGYIISISLCLFIYHIAKIGIVLIAVYGFLSYPQEI